MQLNDIGMPLYTVGVVQGFVTKPTLSYFCQLCYEYQQQQTLIGIGTFTVDKDYAEINLSLIHI